MSLRPRISVGSFVPLFELDRSIDRQRFRSTTRPLHRSLQLLLLVGLCLDLTSCKAMHKEAAVEASAHFAYPAAPENRQADDVGRFFAGLPSRAGSPFAELESSASWKKHKAELDEAWSGVDQDWVGQLKKFSEKELSSTQIRNSIVFYPFSGPDAFLMTAFFPQNRVYVMVGLEPAGTLPDLKWLQKKDLETLLSKNRDTVYSELHRSFFITRQMDRQFRGQVTDGLALPILHLLVRRGNTIVGHRFVRLDEQGNLVERAANYHAPGRIGNKGIQIDYRGPDSKETQTLFYFSVNLSDERLKEDPQFLSFVRSLRGMTTYFKATSYMPHRGAFSLIRNSVLENSSAVLQDDSGIPYRYFTSPEWQVALFGAYDKPFGSFRPFEQVDLRQAYQKGNAHPLSFRIGYGFSKAPSNLLLATRPTRLASR